MKIWFTADTHFGHRRIPLYTRRYFCLSKEERKKVDFIWGSGGPSSCNWSKWTPSWQSISRMNDYLISRINDVVRKDDVLWHLGDFCYAPKNRLEEFVKNYLERINCKNIFLCWGNHDDKRISKYFKQCHERYELNINNKLIVLSHYAQAVWNKSHNGSWMLYGHCHSTAEDWLDKFMPQRLSIDVGVDNVYKIFGEYRPISFEEVNDLFLKRKGLSIDNSQQLKIN
jgi:calcineurin-like phosphoesterase family protein